MNGVKRENDFAEYPRDVAEGCGRGSANGNWTGRTRATGVVEAAEAAGGEERKVLTEARRHGGRGGTPGSERSNHLRRISGDSSLTKEESQNVVAANEAEGEHPVEVLQLDAEVEAANADGFSLIAPYGDWPHNNGMQRVDAGAGRALANALAGAFRRFKALLGGGDASPPVYMGHPDDPGFAAAGHDDHTVYGRVRDVEARADGVYAKIDWSEAGNALLAQGRKLFFSPRWLMRPVGGGAFSPSKLLSIGLTPRPNIRGAAANEQQTRMNALLKKLLSRLGYSETGAAAAANGAEGAPTEEEVLQRLDKVFDAANTEAANAGQYRIERDKAREKLAAANAALAEAAERHQAERDARAELVVANAIRAKRVREADREKEVEALAKAEDFEAAANAVGQRGPVLPTGGASDGLGQRKPEAVAVSNARAEFEAKVSERVDRGMPYDKAWANAKAAHRDLYDRMNQREGE